MYLFGFTIQRHSTADMRVFGPLHPSRHSSMPKYTAVLFFHILAIPLDHFSKCFLTKFSKHLLYSSYPSYNPVLSFKNHFFSSKSLRAWTGLEGSRRLRLPDFKTVGT